jgi:hypothetical protein
LISIQILTFLVAAQSSWESVYLPNARIALEVGEAIIRGQVTEEEYLLSKPYGVKRCWGRWLLIPKCEELIRRNRAGADYTCHPRRMLLDAKTGRVLYFGYMSEQDLYVALSRAGVAKKPPIRQGKGGKKPKAQGTKLASPSDRNGEPSKG